MVNLLDCTIRDGSYAIDYKWKKEDVKEIVTSLVKVGIKYIEVGNGTGLGAYRKVKGALDDDTYLKNSTPFKNKSHIGVFFIPGIGTKEDIKKFKEEGGDFIRIGMNATQSEEAIEYIEYAKSLELFVCFNFMKTYAVSPYQIAFRSNELINSGADCIYVVDSSGGMLPVQVVKYFYALKIAYNVKLGFHGHNNLLMANANSLTAIDSGATFVDSTLMGMGRGTGNAQTESLIALLSKSRKLDDEYDIFELCELSNRVISKITKGLYGVKKRDIVVGMYNFHDSNTHLVDKYSMKYNIDPDKLIIEVSKINIVDPSEELFEIAAKKIVSGNLKEIYFPKFSHKIL
jgi:4-hydroxy 2-oxovalerate aldolase